ncbi:ubiquitin carboxyl-terminal hydrolase [Nesidiocoris tenuis]|uniref:ubiquitinyl hydrolase 1 n=1 Tax=Nesidiocoris tenuis TaxID=355587 RepID=A0ABN7B815_9HEMI|nr:ubiquitin carboxyl-terminal hydrolase [Nesidiocoris tenuis]
MSEVTTDNKMPSTDSELNEYVKRDGEPESRLKRTLSFTRNALNRKRSRKDPPMIIGEMEGQDAKMKKQFLRPSLNKFLNKVVQKMSNLGLQNNKNACSSYMMYGSRRQNNLNTSLSSNDIRVPPVRPGNFPGDKVPGVIGLRNHGNTCFINAVLQCLSHTDILAEYFVLDQYKADLSRRNKLNSKKHGTKGEVTQHLALLLKSIWSCQYDPEISNKFKSVVDKYGSQFRGNNQHDAQEFLLWLLDKVHEDLNTATKKKYKAIKVPLTFSSMKSTWFWVHSVDVCLTT